MLAQVGKNSLIFLHCPEHLFECAKFLCSKISISGMNTYLSGHIYIAANTSFGSLNIYIFVTECANIQIITSRLFKGCMNILTECGNI